MWHLLGEGGTVGREHEAPPASVAHPDKRHVCISLASTVPLIFTSYSSLHSDISRAATSKQKAIWRKYLSFTFRHGTHPVTLSTGCTTTAHTHSHDMQNLRETLRVVNGILQEGFFRRVACFHTYLAKHRRCTFYSVPAHDSCHGKLRRVQDVAICDAPALRTDRIKGTLSI